jgi:hypothetical protein
METNLYDKSGKPLVYISDDIDKTIYLWEGKPVCYIYEDKLYGFNGKHLGWFVNGILYDNDGLRIGYTKNTCPCVTSVQSVKSVKSVKHVKSVRSVAHVKPVLSLSNSFKNLIN